MTGKARGGLGRGLAALIPTGPATTTVADVLINGAPPRREHAPLSLVGETSGTDAADDHAPANGNAAASGHSETDGHPQTNGLRQTNGHSTGQDPATNGKSNGGAVSPGHATLPSTSMVVDISTTGPRYVDIPIDDIRRNPRNPRTVFDEDALVELTHSIR